MSRFRLGVLGGIGPQATGLFYLSLIAALQATGCIKRNEDFPQIIINSIPAPELVFDSVSDERLQPYIDGVKELDACSVDCIVLVCNTIHLFFDELQRECTAPIIDLRLEMQRAVKQQGFNTVSVVGTPCCVQKGLYDFDGVSYVNPSKEQLAVLSDCVLEYTKGNELAQVCRAKKVVHSLFDLGSQCMLLACTELAAMFRNSGIPSINSLDILVAAVVRKYVEK